MTKCREAYLHRFADEEGRKLVHTFYQHYRVRAECDLCADWSPRACRHRAARRAVPVGKPNGSVADLRVFLEAQSPSVHPDAMELQRLFDKYGSDQFSLADQAYIAGMHPLEIVVAASPARPSGASESRESAEATAPPRPGRL